jgi:hypothetical protein
MAIELTSRYGVDKNHGIIKLSQISSIPRNLSDITANVLSIIKVKEYLYSTSQFIILSGNYRSGASRMHCNRKDGVNCRDWTRIRYGGTLDAVKSVVRAIPSSTETPERLPDIHEGPPNLAESNGCIIRVDYKQASACAAQPAWSFRMQNSGKLAIFSVHF